MYLKLSIQQLDDLALAWPAMVQLVFPLHLARSGFRFNQEYLSLFYHGDQFDFLCRRYGALIELGTIIRTELFMYVCSQWEVCRQLKMFLNPR